MSTNSECLFVEVEPGRWYYILEHPDAPKDAFSWLDYATAYGHFGSMQQAHHHLHDNHANPGSYNILQFPGDRLPNVTKLIAECDTRRMTPEAAPSVTSTNGHPAIRPSGRPRLMPSVAMPDRLHPESYRQLRDLVILHGTVLLQRALRDIEAELVAKYEAEALARK